MPDFGRAGTGYGSMQDTFDAAAGRSSSGPSRSDTGTTTDEVYQSFVESSQPRGLSAIERAIQNKTQDIKNFFSQKTSLKIKNF